MQVSPSQDSNSQANTTKPIHRGFEAGIPPSLGHHATRRDSGSTSEQTRAFDSEAARHSRSFEVAHRSPPDRGRPSARREKGSQLAEDPAVVTAEAVSAQAV